MAHLTTLAIADDHVMFRKTLMAFFSRLPLRFIVEASNGRELLDKLEASAECPQVCILDISMPVMDGHNALAEIRKRWPEMSVLILTILESEATAIKMLQNGASGYVVKGGPPEELERAILAIIQTGHYESGYSASNT